MEHDSGKGPAAAVHQGDGDGRAHRGLALGQVAGARRALLATDAATTVWDEPVSTMKSRYVPLPNRRRTFSEMSPGVNATVSGMVVPAWPCSRTAAGEARSGRGPPRHCWRAQTPAGPRR